VGLGGSRQPRRSARPHAFWRALHFGGPRLWLAEHHHQPHGNRSRRQSTARAIRCQCIFGASRRRLSFCGALGRWRRHNAIRRRAFHDVRSAWLCRAAVAGSNAFALAYGAKDVTDARSELGIRTDKSFSITDGVLILRSRLGWAHDFNPDRSIAATFEALPGASFVVNGAVQAAYSALVTTSVERKWINGWSAAATFEGDFSDVTRSYAGKGVVRYQW
jgi:Autotransporter beta-domain